MLNRDYNTQRYNLSKEKKYLFLFTHCSFTHCVFSLTLSIFLFSFCLLSLMQFFKTAPVLTLQDLLFSLSLFFSSLFTLSAQMAEWPLPLFLFYFLLFSLSHSSHQVTINTSQLILTLLQPISFLQLCHSRMTLAFLLLSFLSSFSVSNTPKPTNPNNSC